jgi:predicted phage-related endonuclease
VLLQRQLESLGAQRAGLEDMLKEMKRKVLSFIAYFDIVYINYYKSQTYVMTD